MKLDTLLNKFERLTKQYEKILGEEIPPSYYSSCEGFIQRAWESNKMNSDKINKKMENMWQSGRSQTLEEIKEIVEKYKDPTFGTYDYDGIAVEVIKLVTK